MRGALRSEAEIPANHRSVSPKVITQIDGMYFICIDRARSATARPDRVPHAGDTGAGIIPG